MLYTKDDVIKWVLTHSKAYGQLNSHKGYGAILGDMVGVPYEMNPIYTREFDFFNKDNHFSDDTILTIATMSKLLNDSSYFIEYKYWGNKYYGDYYGKGFKEWLKREDYSSNDSYGNGAAMRVSPIGYVMDTWETVKDESIKSAIVSHDNDEAKLGAHFVANTIFKLRQSKRDKRTISDTAKAVYGDLYPTVLEPFTKFKVRCNDTVPVAVKCFVDGYDISSVIRNAVSIGGDCDTIASMAAEMQVAYDGGMNNILAKYVENNLPADMLYVLKEFNKKFNF